MTAQPKRTEPNCSDWGGGSPGLPRGALTCSRKTRGSRHISHSSSGSSGRPLRLSHAGFPPTLLGNCGDRSRHRSASSRKPRTTSAENFSVWPDIVDKLPACLSLRYFIKETLFEWKECLQTDITQPNATHERGSSPEKRPRGNTTYLAVFRNHWVLIGKLLYVIAFLGLLLNCTFKRIYLHKYDWGVRKMCCLPRTYILIFKY